LKIEKVSELVKFESS